MVEGWRDDTKEFFKWLAPNDTVFEGTQWLLDLVVSCIPYLGDVRDVVELITGRNMLEDKELTTGERITTAVCMFIPFVGAKVGREIFSWLGKNIDKWDEVVEFVSKISKKVPELLDTIAKKLDELIYEGNIIAAKFNNKLKEVFIKSGFLREPILEGIDDIYRNLDDIEKSTVFQDLIKKINGNGVSTTSTKISNEMENKILEGQRKTPTKNEVIGGHSSNINNNNGDFAVEVLSVNPDGTRNIKFVKDLKDGNVSKIKRSTVFPESWDDSKIINSVKEVGDSPIVAVRQRDGATWHRLVIDGVEIDVIKLGDDVISGYPTGKVNAPKPSGF